MRTKTSLVGLASLALSIAAVAPAAHADRVVPNSEAGAVHVFGVTGSNEPFAPYAENYTDERYVSVTSRADLNRFAITVDGSLERIKTNGAASHDIPAAVAGQRVISVDATKFNVAAVTADGIPHLWGTGRTIVYSMMPTTEAELGGKVVQVAVGERIAAVLLDNGKVGVLTTLGYEVLDDFENVVEIDASGSHVIVRFDGGGLLAWTVEGLLELPVGIISPPAAIAGDQLVDPVVDFEVGSMGIAVTQSGHVETWDFRTGDGLENYSYPSGATGKVVDVAALSWNENFMARTDANELILWGAQSGGTAGDAFRAGAAEWTGNEDVASLTGAEKGYQVLVAEQVPLSITTPATIVGTPKAGQTLTGVPATYGGAPDAVTYKWLVDGVEVAGTTPTTLLLDESMVGKSVTFVSTAVRGGETLDSASAPFGPVTEPENATSTTAVTISPSTGRYGLTRTATVTVAKDAGTPTGNVSVKVAGLTKSAPLVGGTAKIVLPKLNAGSHTLVASYAGDDSTQASSKTVKVAVSKASTSTKVSAVKIVKKGKKVTVSTKTAFPSGVTRTGTVKFVIKRGSKTVAKGTAKVSSSGVATFAAKKLTKKGKYKITATYAGTSNISASSAKKTFAVK